MGVYNKTIIPLVLVRIDGVSVGLNLEKMSGHPFLRDKEDCP